MSASDDFQLMEHFALWSPLSLQEICTRLERSLHTSPFRFDSENETEWGEARLGGLVIDVSCPYEDGTLQEWDRSVPDGANVAVSICVPKSEPCAGPEWSLKELVPRLARAIASTLETNVVHHRTWTGPGKNIERAQGYRAVPERNEGS